MLVHQFEAKGLSHYSYMLWSKEDNEAAVIDPARDIQTYIQFAAENRLKIKYILETHIHADYASGARELAEKTDTRLLLSSYDTNEKYEYAFPHQEVKEGDKFQLGHIELRILHTPGHTPEHISFVAEVEGKPVALFSGDFLFVGSVGRPDLLGDADKHPLAEKMYQSVTTKLIGLPDDVIVYPGHGAGSLCGAGMGKASTTTLGEERKHNEYLQPMSKEDFVNKLLGVNTPFPEYYLRMKTINSQGPDILDGLPTPKAMSADEFETVACTDGTILDVRHPLAFGGGHIDDSINIGTDGQLSFWGSWILPYDRPIYMVLDDEEKLEDHLKALIRVGHDNIAGYLKIDFDKWVSGGKDFIDLPQVSVHALQDFIDAGEKLSILDVRSESEWKSGHVKKAKHIYLGELPKKMKEIPKDDAVFCICGGGYRSSIAASLLQKNGYDEVYNVFGGMTAWKAAKLEVASS